MSDSAIENLGLPGDSSDQSPSFVMKFLWGFFWTVSFVLLLIGFTVLKLPETRIKNYVQGMIQAQLAPQGIGFTAESGSLSLFLTPSYALKGVTLTPPAPANPIRLDHVRVAPALLSLIRGKIGGAVEVRHGPSRLELTGSFKPSAQKIDLDVAFDADQIDLGKLGVLPLAIKLQGAGLLNGQGRIRGDLQVPSSIEGEVKLDLTQFTIEQQSFMGFAIPKLGISTTRIDLFIDRGKGSFKSFTIGKEGTSDDLIGKIEGDIILGKQMESSTLNLKTRFKLSDKILKAFALIDALLGAGKQPDGAYAFNVAGPLLSPMPTPLGQ